MSVNLALGVGGLLAVGIFIVWIVKRGEKLGEAETQVDHLAEHAESMDGINQMEKAIDEQDGGDLTTLDDAGDYLDGLPDDDQR